MKRDDFVDFFFVPDEQVPMHLRLENWSRYVSVRPPAWMSPMWKQGRANGRQWHVPELKPDVDTLDGHALEKAVGALPMGHRDSLRWFYVWRTPPVHARKVMGCTNQGLMRLLGDARLMLRNRKV